MRRITITKVILSVQLIKQAFPPWEKVIPKVEKKSANLKNGLNKETDIAAM